MAKIYYIAMWSPDFKDSLVSSRIRSSHVRPDADSVGELAKWIIVWMSVGSDIKHIGYWYSNKSNSQQNV